MSHIICGILYIAQRSVHSFVNKIRVDFGLWKNFTSNKTVIFCFISVLECILPQLFWIGFRTRLICLKYKQVEIWNSLSAIKDDDRFWGACHWPRPQSFNLLIYALWRRFASKNWQQRVREQNTVRPWPNIWSFVITQSMANYNLDTNKQHNPAGSTIKLIFLFKTRLICSLYACKATTISFIRSYRVSEFLRRKKSAVWLGIRVGFGFRMGFKWVLGYVLGSVLGLESVGVRVGTRVDGNSWAWFGWGSVSLFSFASTCSKIRNIDSILFSISEFISDLMWTIIGCFKISGHTVDHFILSEHLYQMYF